MVAGETSGDLLAGLLLDGLHERWPQLQAAASAGRRWPQRGFETWWPSEALAVRGYVEVLRHYRGNLRHSQAAQGPAAAASARRCSSGSMRPTSTSTSRPVSKAQGIKTVHFVCPSIWAWRADRVEKLQRSVDHVLCIFPFEPALLASHGIAATYVGHPLASVIPMQPDRQPRARQLGLRPDDQVVAVLPGSRRSEVQYLASRFFEAAALIRQARPAIKFIVAGGAGAAGHAGAAWRWPARHGSRSANPAGPVAHRAGRLRCHPDRQRHGDAGGGAVQAARW